MSTQILQEVISVSELYRDSNHWFKQLVKHVLKQDKKPYLNFKIKPNLTKQKT
jgi:hypothetical protein